MLSVFAAVLAFAGAPAGTPVGCYPHLVNSDYGNAIFAADGSATIKLDAGFVCVAAQFAAADRAGRTAIAQAHPGLAMTQVYGVGMLVMLHEAEHVALHSTDECLVEKMAFAKLPGLLRMFMPRLWESALAFARSYDAARPPAYHGC